MSFAKKVFDMEMHYEIVGEGEPLLLLHGGGGIGDNWHLIFQQIPAGFQMIIPDMRGHGRSLNPMPGFTFRQLAQDAFTLLDHLNIQKFKAIGMSLGAKTLLHMATQQPERVTDMILVSATPYFPEEAKSAMRAMTPENRTEAEWNQMRKWHVYGDEQIEKIWSQMKTWGHGEHDMNFTRESLSTIKSRTLIVHGDRDPLYPVELALEMYRAIPNCSLWIVPNGGHGPIFGSIAEQFVKIALNFLNHVD